jgi:hypothetical protein
MLSLGSFRIFSADFIIAMPGFRNLAVSSCALLKGNTKLRLYLTSLYGYKRLIEVLLDKQQIKKQGIAMMVKNLSRWWGSCGSKLVVTNEFKKNIKW